MQHEKPLNWDEKISLRFVERGDLFVLVSISKIFPFTRNPRGIESQKRVQLCLAKPIQCNDVMACIDVFWLGEDVWCEVLSSQFGHVWFRCGINSAIDYLTRAFIVVQKFTRNDMMNHESNSRDDATLAACHG